MNQLTFSDIEYSNRKKKTQEFLDAMEIPNNMIRPYYFNNQHDCKPISIETSMYLMQIWFNLSGEGIEVQQRFFTHRHKIFYSLK